MVWDTLLTYLMDRNICWFWDTFAKEEDFKFRAIQTNISIFEFKDFSNEIKVNLCSFISFNNAEGATK